MYNDVYSARAQARTEHKDIFEYPSLVVPIKTGGRHYGAISRRASDLGWPFPDILPGQVRHEVHDGKFVLFACVWAHESEFTDHDAFRMMQRIITVHRTHNDPVELAVPILGGKPPNPRQRWAAMEKALEDAEDELEHMKMELNFNITFVALDGET